MKLLSKITLYIHLKERAFLAHLVLLHMNEFSRNELFDLSYDN